MTTGGAIRVQIHLKYIFVENRTSTKEFYKFWYAFQSAQLPTIADVLRDIRVNYFKDQIEDVVHNDRALIVHLNDCQLLPFSSSQILRDNDRLTIMPVENYKLHQTSLRDSIALDSSVVIAQPSNTHKRQRVDSVENNVSFASTSTITPAPATENGDDQPSKKKKKAKKSTLEERIIPPPAPPTEESASILSTSAILEAIADEPISLPSNAGSFRELKSKTSAWKSKPPESNGDAKDKVHIRFDSDNDDEPSVETKPEEILPVNNSNSSIRVDYHVSPPVSADVIEEKPKKTKQKKKKTIDLLFEMKQCKEPAEKEGKRIQQQFGRKRAQHRKRTLDYFSLASFVDSAFGLDKTNGDQQQDFNENRDSHTSSSSSPQTLPTSFNKLGRLPLVAEAIKINDKIYDLYPPIVQCPPIQTRLAFKMLELSEDFCPKMSEFKEGTVIDMDSTTGALTIALDKPLQTVFDQPSKFYAPIDEIEEAAIIVLSFSELNFARQLPSERET